MTLQAAKRIANIHFDFNADKHSPDSSVWSTKTGECLSAFETTASCSTMFHVKRFPSLFWHDENAYHP